MRTIKEVKKYAKKKFHRIKMKMKNFYKSINFRKVFEKILGNPLFIFALIVVAIGIYADWNWYQYLFVAIFNIGIVLIQMFFIWIFGKKEEKQCFVFDFVSAGLDLLKHENRLYSGYKYTFDDGVTLEVRVKIIEKEKLLPEIK